MKKILVKIKISLCRGKAMKVMIRINIFLHTLGGRPALEESSFPKRPSCDFDCNFCPNENHRIMKKEGTEMEWRIYERRIVYFTIP